MSDISESLESEVRSYCRGWTTVFERAPESLLQGLTLKLLSGELSLTEIEQLLEEDNEWAKVVPNTKQTSMAELSPVPVSGTLDIPVGRIRKLEISPQHISAFSVGDQLPWDAAKRMRHMPSTDTGNL
jgi:aspartate-semialdehyde dehydrogenase